MKKLFNSIDRKQLIINFLYSIFIVFIVIKFDMVSETWQYFYCFISFMLYPFAKLVYDELINDISSFSNIQLSLTIFIYFIFVFLKHLLLFTFSSIVAPVGLMILYLKQRKIKNN